MDKLIVRGKDAPSLPSLSWDVPLFNEEDRLVGVKRLVHWVLPVKPNSAYLVLIVNDNKDAVEFYAEILRWRGYQLATAYDGIEGLDAVMSQPPDVILLNNMMPRLDGPGMLARLRADPKTAGIKVIMECAGMRGKWASQIDAQDFIHVPIAPLELYETVSRVLRS